MKLLKLLRISALAFLVFSVLTDFISPSIASATKTLYYRTGLIGGAATDLDAQDGAALADGDFAFVMDGTHIYPYLLDDDSGAAESSPSVISPDTNAGTKRWILQGTYAATANVSPPSGVEITGNIAGMILSNDTDTDHDINISSGACFDSTNTYHISAAAGITKRLDAAWAAGDDSGGLLNGSIATDTLYHIYALRKDADGTADYGFLADGDTLATYLPAGYSAYRWVGYVLTDASANIRNFKMLGSGSIISFNAAFEAITNLATAGYVSQDLSSFAPAGRVDSVTLGGNDTGSNAELQFSIDGAETGNSIYTSTGATWEILMASAINPMIADIPLTAAGAVYMRCGQTVDVWLKAVKIIR